MIVVSIGNEETGLLVERVTGVVGVWPDEIKPAPETAGQGVEAELVRG
ncbi:MAG TPA: chemotaxis protein CheW, partial [Nitrospiraceae bacterium]|nr:chemotaxis protein CheW [Nitrospiraceae bacterium]